MKLQLASKALLEVRRQKVKTDRRWEGGWGNEVGGTSRGILFLSLKNYSFNYILPQVHILASIKNIKSMILGLMKTCRIYKILIEHNETSQC